MTRVKDDYRNLSGMQKAAIFMLSIGLGVFFLFTLPTWETSALA